MIKIGCCDNVSRAVGVLAELLNKSADVETFYNRSKNYKNVWNKERELMCPRSKSGKFHCPLDPTLNTWIVKDDGFTEGEIIIASSPGPFPAFQCSALTLKGREWAWSGDKSRARIIVYSEHNKRKYLNSLYGTQYTILYMIFTQEILSSGDGLYLMMSPD